MKKNSKTSTKKKRNCSTAQQMKIFGQEELYQLTPASQWLPKIKKTMEKKTEILRFSIKGALLVLIIIMLPSCLTVGMIERNCDKFAAVCEIEQETIYKETVRIDTIWEKRDSLIYIPIKGDTVIKTNTVYIKDGLANSDTLSASVQFAEAKAWVKDNKLNLTLEQLEQLWEYEIELRDRTIRELTEQLKQKTVVIKRTWWQQILDVWYLYAIIILLILWIIDNIIKNKK